MKTDSDEIPKRYFKIGEVAKNLGVANSAIRFWEYCFGIEGHRTKGGFRYFDQSEVETLSKIKILLKERGFTVAGAKRELERRGF